VAALHEHRKRMLAEGNAAAPIFCAPEGGYLRKGNFLRRSFWQIIDAVNARAKEQAEQTQTDPVLLPRLRFHDLRHTCASLLLLANENVKVVSERLGHANVQLTSDTYQHCSPTMQKAAAAKMGAIFAGFSAPPPAAAKGPEILSG
jgi:integrase